MRELRHSSQLPSTKIQCVFFRWELSKSPVHLLNSSYSSPKRQPTPSLSLQSDPRETLTYNISSSNLTKKQSVAGYCESGSTVGKDKPSAITSTSTASLTTANKGITSYRRELSTGYSYDETKAACFHRSIEASSQPDIYSNNTSNSNNTKPETDHNMHLMSQNNTQTKQIMSSYKHLVPLKGVSTSADSQDDYTPRGKAAALLGAAETASSAKYKLTEVPQTPTRISPFVGQHSKSRRNSDPSSNKISMLEVNRGNDMYQSSTHINIAGHRFHKAGRIGKGEKCASCQENDAFVNEGHRCLDCKLLVHTKCIQNGGVKSLQCEKSSKRQTRSKNMEKALSRNSKYSGTREYTDSADKIISDAKELQLMQDFIAQKIYKMDTDCDKTAAVDRAFKQALREFKDNLVAQYSIAHKQKSDTLNIKYRDLISNFEQVMETCGNKTDDFPLTMCVNGFRVFMNEFMNSREMEKPKAKRKKEKKRKVDEHTSYNGESVTHLHEFA